MSGPRFVDVPADRLLGELGAIGNAVIKKDGRYVLSRHGSELVVDVMPPNGVAMVRIYTSLAAHASHVRGCGEDAVRMFVCWPKTELPAPVPVGGDVLPVLAQQSVHVIPLEESQKILRTAPQGASDRVAVFLARLRDEVRAAYARALAVPRCPVCEKLPLKLRSTRDGKRRFFGCVGFPACRGTMNESEVARRAQTST